MTESDANHPSMAFMRSHARWSHWEWAVVVAVAAAITALGSPPIALTSGMAVSLLLGNPYLERVRTLTKHLLSWSVVGLGAGADVHSIERAGITGIVYSLVSIVTTMLIGTGLGAVLGVATHPALLISVGTAICGGSAIAAVAPAIRAKHDYTSIALAIVFLLNAVALFVFPLIGRRLQLSEAHFGLWCALAIHDTSSVIGAAMEYGPAAVVTGVAVKLTRALWIAPMTIAIAYARSSRDGGPSGYSWQPPWFIVGFVVVAALASWIPALGPAASAVKVATERSMRLTLFVIGLGVTRATFTRASVRPLVHGVLLWIGVAMATLAAIVEGLIEAG